jgi:hypothetical protein
MNRSACRQVNGTVRSLDRYLTARIAFLATLRSLWSALT